jgi:protein-S-isoprenylcysteine O-methyltransferase Ste14
MKNAVERPSDGADVRFPPPLVPLIALVAGVALQRFAWPFPVPLGGIARYGLGGALALFGLALIAAALRLFRRTGQDPAPWESTPEIITTGVYRLTRNPMYVGLGLVQAGAGVMLANAWVIALVPVALGAIHVVAIRRSWWAPWDSNPRPTG